MTNSKHTNNKTKDVLVLGRDFIQNIDDTTIYAEKMFSPNFSVENETFCLSLHYNSNDSYLFVNGKEVTKFKAKYPTNGLYQTQMCLRNISSDFDLIDRKSTGLYGYVYDFSVDYSTTVVDDILDINKYLMKKNNII